jgi:hypothetical protein
MQEVRTVLIQSLLRLAPHTQIVHHIPGRIRLRILPSGLAAVRGVNLEDIENNMPGILGIRVNRLIGSVVIEYDQNRLQSDFWESLSNLGKSPELAMGVEDRLRSLWD